MRRTTEKRLDLIAFGSETADSVDALAEHLIADGVRLDREPGRPDTPGGGYGFRFSDPEGRLLEVSCYVEQRAAHCWSPASRFRSGSATW
ncbi:VOC family protein [Streptomyces sp. NPDC004726]